VIHRDGQGEKKGVEIDEWSSEVEKRNRGFHGCTLIKPRRAKGTKSESHRMDRMYRMFLTMTILKGMMKATQRYRFDGSEGLGGDVMRKSNKRKG